MREMTQGELYSWYERGQWPCGHGSRYIPGPRGGLSRNIECPTCGMRINVVDPESGYKLPVGQVISAPAGYVPPALPQRAVWMRHLRAIRSLFRR